MAELIELPERPGPGADLRPEPTAEQRAAADPRHSAWVTASAGTGKTRVLADRVLRLLMNGAAPERLLCLTFTKAGAAEMTARIRSDLAQFASLADPDLDEALRRLEGRPPEGRRRSRARQLLSHILDLPQGLQIQTLHGFAQTLLRRFPLEAGLAPHFQVIDPREIAALMREAREGVLADPPAEVARALPQLAVQFAETTIAEGLGSLLGARLRLTPHLRQPVATWISSLGTALGIPPDSTRATVIAAACSDATLDISGLRRAARALLAGGGVDDGSAARLIEDWLDADAPARAQTFEGYRGAFLTQKGEPKKRLLVKAAESYDPGARPILEAECERLLRWLEHWKAAGVLDRTRALLTVGAAVLDRYETLKGQGAVLDYDDLIARTLALLGQPDIAGWVRFKLDQEVDHLLVDEGQDTSPAQWTIVEALAHEFFAGAGARPAERTLFVVGDEKQSIFSFLGADVATFQRLQAHFRSRAAAAGAPWCDQPLTRSFRSRPAILSLVDAVFASEAMQAGVVGAGGWLPHESHRSDTRGSIELWPLLEPERPEPPPPGWSMPDDYAIDDDPERELARILADRIKQMLDGSEQLAGREKPIGPGDILVLLQRRSGLQDRILRRLKQHQVPVAGADRIALEAEIGVRDLMALGDAVLLPEDDLTFAALLRSPLFDLSEATLFELAHGRGRTPLFRRLAERAATDSRCAQAQMRFAGARRLADLMPPFEFFSHILAGEGGWRRLLERLGPAAIEPIEAFLARALVYERSHPPSLQGFLHWLRADESEVVRDPDEARDEVRVLTVHGAKGLEAPVVLIADAAFIPQTQDKLLWLEASDFPVWRVGRDKQDKASEKADRAAETAREEEYRRLLYVALTRAADRLIIAGFKRDRQAGRSWYDMIRDGLERLPGVERVRLNLDPRLDGDILRYGDDVRAGGSVAARAVPMRPAGTPRGQFELDLASGPKPTPPARPLPTWLREPAPPERAPPPVSPSHLSDEDAASPALSPLAGGDNRFRRGRLVHRLLQILPGRPLTTLRTAASRLLAQERSGLGPDEMAAIVDEVVAILTTPDFAPLFGPNSRAEVPIVGEIDGRPVSGQIDRLALSGTDVLVVDYKTNRSPPTTADDVPAGYRNQLGAYRELLEKIFPDHRIRTALLWTAGPKIMWL